jgi:hypothetical protein
MYVLILCARTLVLVAWLLCLLNVGISYAVDRSELDAKPSFSASTLRKGEEKLFATRPSHSAAQNSVDCSSCFPSIRLYSFWNASDRKKRKVAAAPSGSYGEGYLNGAKFGQISQAEIFPHHLKKDEDDDLPPELDLLPSKRHSTNDISTTSSSSSTGGYSSSSHGSKDVQ